MALLLKDTAYNRMIFMVAASDHVTGLASLTLTITASKNGAAFGSIAPTVTDLTTGWYNLAFTTTHTNTLGDLALHITGTAADPLDFVDQVIAFPLNVATVVVGTNNDKTGYTASTVSDKTGYSLSASQTTNITGNLSGSVGSVTAGVTVTTNNDKTGYTASTVSDKTGYSLSSPQVINITGNLSGSVGSVTSPVVATSVTNPVTAGTVSDKTGYSLSNPQAFHLIVLTQQVRSQMDIIRLAWLSLI